MILNVFSIAFAIGVNVDDQDKRVQENCLVVNQIPLVRETRQWDEGRERELWGLGTSSPLFLTLEYITQTTLVSI